MSTLEGVCERSDTLAKLVLQYLALRASERLYEAKRVRDAFRDAADAALAEGAAARVKRDDALRITVFDRPIPSLRHGQALPGICRCGCPSCPQPPLNPANDSSLSMGPNLA